MTRKTANLKLAVLPDDEAILAAVAYVLENDPRARHGATANIVAQHLRIQGARRAGRGAVKGSWSGTMSPALRLAPRMRALARAGRLVAWERDYRWVYRLP